MVNRGGPLIVDTVMRMMMMLMVGQMLATRGRRRALRRHHLLPRLLLLLCQHSSHLCLLLWLLLEMHLGMPLLLITASKLTATDVARERLLARMGANMGGQVVWAWERAHADAALERLLARMDADMTGQLVRPGEPSVAVLDRAAIRSLVDGRLTRPIRVFAGLHRNQFEGQRWLLVGLLQDFMAFAGRGVVLGQLHVARRSPTRGRLDVNDIDAAAGNRWGVARLLLGHHHTRRPSHTEGWGSRIVGWRVDPLVLGHRRTLHQAWAYACIQQVVGHIAGRVGWGLLRRYVVVAAVDVQAEQFDLLLRSVVVGLWRRLLLLGSGRRRTRAGGWVRLVGLGGGLGQLLRQQAEQRREQVLLQPRAGAARAGGVGWGQAGAADLHRVWAGRREDAAVAADLAVVGRQRRARVHGDVVVVVVRRLRRRVVQRLDLDFRVGRLLQLQVDVRLGGRGGHAATFERSCKQRKGLH